MLNFLSEKEMSVNVWEPVVEQKTDTLLHTGKVAVSHASSLMPTLKECYHPTSTAVST